MGLGNRRGFREGPFGVVKGSYWIFLWHTIVNAIISPMDPGRRNE